MTNEELNAKIAYTRQVIATTSSYKCKNDHIKSLNKLLNLKRKNERWKR